MAIVSENASQALYRYLRLSGDYGRPGLEAAILNKELWWASPVDFNDPFDCDPVIELGRNKSQYHAFGRRAAKETLKNVSRNERRVRGNSFRTIPKRNAEKYVAAHFRDSMNKSGIVCYSDIPDSLLMWSHYADCHQGVCLIFTPLLNEIDLQRSWLALPVNYTDDRPVVNLANIRELKEFENAVLNKSADWAYEREWRMISYKGGKGYRKFPPQALTGIILGAKISDDDRDFVLSLCSGRNGINIYKAEFDKHKFRVVIEGGTRGRFPGGGAFQGPWFVIQARDGVTS